MRKLSIFSLGIALLMAGTMLVAQVPDGDHIFANPPIRVENILPLNSPSGYFPDQVRAAYGFNRIPNLGAGQTIALVDAYDDPNIVSDLAFYANYFHKTPCNFTKVIVGSPLQGQGWDLEESLDVQQACGLAPQANIILVEANSNSFTDLLTAVAVATAPPYNATVVSMSWGGGEFGGENSYDSYFCNITNGNGQAVTFFASSGDGGHGVIYPSASPCVIAVGGTTLVLLTSAPLATPTGSNYGTENAWHSGGGGISSQEAEPSWQNSACAPYSPAGFRCVPDVASVATNIPVYDTYSFGGWVTVGGTSISSPDWASFMTLVNSVRANNGHGTLSQAVQDMYNIYYTGNYAGDFNDIVTGTNGSCGLDCDAETGYDLTTGLGTYKANHLYSDLAAATN